MNGKIKDEMFVKKLEGFFNKRQGKLCSETEGSTLWSKTRTKSIEF